MMTTFEHFSLTTRTGCSVTITFEDNALLFGIDDDNIRIMADAFNKKDAIRDPYGIFGIHKTFWDPIEHPVLRDLLSEYSHNLFVDTIDYKKHIFYVWLYMYCEQHPTHNDVSDIEMFLIPSSASEYILYLEKAQLFLAYFRNGLLDIELNSDILNLPLLAQCHHQSKQWHDLLLTIDHMDRDYDISSWMTLLPSQMEMLMMMNNITPWTYQTLSQAIVALSQNNYISELDIL